MAEQDRSMFRVDPRLVHATLMNAWVPATEARWLLIADAQVANDARRRTIYEMSAADAVEVRFVAEPGAAGQLAELEADGPGIVLFSSLGGVLRAMRGGLSVRKLNVGHVPSGPGRTEVHPAVHLGSGDLEMLRQIEALGVVTKIQPLPDDDPLTADLPDAPDSIRSGPKAPAAPPPPPKDPTAPAAPAAPPRSPSAAGSATRATGVFEVVNERGLHLRAAHVFAALCNELPNEVKVGRQGDMVNAKSLLGLTTLGAARGSRLDVVVEGAGAEAALERIRELFAGGFQEGAGAA